MNNYMSDAQAKYIKNLILKVTNKTKKEIESKYANFYDFNDKGEKESKLTLRIKKDGTFDKVFVDRFQASGLINTLKGILENGTMSGGVEIV